MKKELYLVALFEELVSPLFICYSLQLDNKPDIAAVTYRQRMHIAQPLEPRRGCGKSSPGIKLRTRINDDLRPTGTATGIGISIWQRVTV